MNWISSTAQGVMLQVHACPRAARDAAQGLHGDAVKIRLRAPPVEGRANEALVEFLSQVLQVPKNAITIVAGHGGRAKRLAIAGVNAATVRARLGV
jgi:uncharacterized protein